MSILGSAFFFVLKKVSGPGSINIFPSQMSAAQRQMADTRWHLKYFLTLKSKPLTPVHRFSSISVSFKPLKRGWSQPLKRKLTFTSNLGEPEKKDRDNPSEPSNGTLTKEHTFIAFVSRIAPSFSVLSIFLGTAFQISPLWRASQQCRCEHHTIGQFPLWVLRSFLAPIWHL